MFKVNLVGRVRIGQLPTRTNIQFMQIRVESNFMSNFLVQEHSDTTLVGVNWPLMVAYEGDLSMQF